MEIYKLQLKPESSWLSPLQSDTFFGAFCWSLKYLYGDNEVTALCKQCIDGNPPIIFSNGFGNGIVPSPMIGIDYSSYLSKTKKSENLNEYISHKKLKKLEFITLEGFNRIANGENCLEKRPKRQKAVITYGNMIDRRFDSVVENEDGGALFTRSEVYLDDDNEYSNTNDYQKNKQIDLYVKLESTWVEKFNKTFRIACLMGFGADKSVGKGIFELISMEKFDGFKAPNKPNAFMTLSNYIPSKNDPVDGYYKTIVKYSKHDRELSRTDSPFKKPLLMLSEGAVFYTESVNEYYGRAVKKVSTHDENIIQNGFAFVLPMCINKL